METKLQLVIIKDTIRYHFTGDVKQGMKLKTLCT